MDEYDVVVVGGGAAGLAAAVALARSRRRVLVVDAGEPRNAPAEGIHNFLTREGTPPHQLLADGRDDVRQYGGEVRDGRATSATHLDDAFEVALADGDRVRARRLLAATGVVDRLPPVEGLEERWGRDVLHCPYCHGYEVRDQAIGVLATGPNAEHQALMFAQLSPSVTLLAHLAPPSAESRARLAAAGVRVVAGTVVAVETDRDTLCGVRLEDETVVPLQALVVAPYSVVSSPLLASLGVAPVPHPSGLGESVEVDLMGRTGVPGVFATGNLTDLGAQVMGAAAAGTRAGAAINMDLIEADLSERLSA